MPKISKVTPLQANINIEALNQVAESATAMVQRVRSSMLAPQSRKSPPVFNSAQLAELTGLDLSQVQYQAKRGVLPSGDKEGSNRREWSLVEARQWIQTIKHDHMRDPSLSSGVTITVANFKGGVTKTTTAAALAQGLALRGHKVLVVDTDPQGSLTTLFGVLPDAEVDENDTILPLCAGVETSIMPSVRSTYFDGIDLVPAAPVLFNAEFLLPARQKEERDFAFWRVLDAGLEEARSVYDVIVIDTPPSLSYITINGLIAADGIVMPLPPNALDFASSAQFWNLFTEVCGDLFKARQDSKSYFFVDVVLARVDKSDAISTAVREWIIGAYGSKVLPIEIPKTSVAATASAEFGTVYDMNASSIQAKTLKRARDAYDQLVDHIEVQVAGIWNADVQAAVTLKAKSSGGK
jgi:chromosome partitioning protein